MRRESRDRRAFMELVQLTSNRYVGAGPIAHEFARGKLRGDPIYEAVIRGPLLRALAPREPASPAASRTPGGTLIDVGCGAGLTLALLAEARRAIDGGSWPAGWPPPPCFDRLIGLELRRRAARIAAAALGGEADVRAADARTATTPQARVILLFDVLHMMGGDDQDALFAALATTLAPDGLMLIREADAAAGWRFTAVRIGNRLKAVALGHWRQHFHFRSADGWRRWVASHGLHAELFDMSEGTPFGNVLLAVTHRGR